MTTDDYKDMLMTAKDARDDLDDLILWVSDPESCSNERDDVLINLVGLAQQATAGVVAYITNQIEERDGPAHPTT